MKRKLLKRLAATVVPALLAPSIPALAEDTFPEYSFSADDCVREQPEGELKTYQRDGGNLKSYLGGVAAGEQNGLKMDLVFADDGKTVWFHNLVSTAQDCFVWTKGEIRDDRIVIPQGTPMWFYDFGTYTTAYVLCNLKENPDSDPSSPDGFECIPGDIEFSYVDGVVKLLPNSSGIAAVGLQRYSTDPFIIDNGFNYKWLGYGDINSEYTVFDEIPVSEPKDTGSAARYAFTYKSEPGGATCGHLVDVLEEDGKLRVRGLSQIFGSDYWTTADMVGNKVIFPAKQYLGIDRDGYDDFFLYLCSSRMSTDGEYFWMDFADDTVFERDETTGVMTSDESLIMNRGDEMLLIGDWWMDMRLAPYEEKAVMPASPSIGAYYEYDEYMEQCRVSVEIPCLDVDGNFIDPANLYFQMYINGEVYTFEPSDYHYFELPEPMTELPYGFTCYEIYMYSTGMWSIDFFGEEPETIGVQTISKAGGETMMSDVVTFVTTGVENVSASEEIVSERYFNLSGMPVGEDYKGVVIRNTRYADGSSVNTKLMRR